MNPVETGFYYLQSRYYDPESCRFLNADEPSILEVIGTSLLGANLYAYCGNNPLINSDPTGYYYIKIKDVALIILYMLGFAPIPSVLIVIGLYKLKVWIVTKLAALGAKLGAFWGPVASAALSILMGVMGLYIGGQIAAALWECAWTGKKGIEFKIKTGWFRIPYTISIYAR